MTSPGKFGVHAVVGRLADGAATAVARAKERLARTDASMARVKAEVRSRRRILDVVLRRKKQK